MTKMHMGIAIAHIKFEKCFGYEPILERIKILIKRGKALSNALTSAEIEQLAQAERLRLLYQQSFPAILASLLTGLLVCVVLWPVQQPSLLLGWYALLAVSGLLRILLFGRYWLKRPADLEILDWERPYVLTLLFSSVIWGLGILLIIPADSALHQVVVFFFLMGMSGGAIAVYSAHRFMTLSTIACVLLPITIWFVFQGTWWSSMMVIGVVTFFITAVRAGGVLSATMDKSFKLAHELTAARDVAERLAREDELTGLSNRRAFYELGQLLLENCRRHDGELRIILMDVDFFKNVNDAHGHAVGDEVLKAIAAVLKRSLRSSDVCARVGGEEFAMLLQTRQPKHAVQLAQKLCREIEALQFSLDRFPQQVTASFGVSSGDCDLDSLFRYADKALYQAKDAGRNQVKYIECRG